MKEVSWERQQDRMPKDRKVDEDKVGGEGSRWQNLCMLKQDSQIYKEEVHTETEEDGSTNVTQAFTPDYSTNLFVHCQF